jgi:hypothetical protein
MAGERVDWTAAEPSRFAAELQAVAAAAPDLAWDEGAGAWIGEAPEWPFSRPRPAGLEEFLGGRRLLLRVEYSQAFPMVAPRVVPLRPEPDPMVRTQHDWHVNGDGSLCLLQRASDWEGIGTAAELVVKASAWFLEYLLMEAGRIEHMSEAGLVNDDSLDHLLGGGD